MELLVARHPDFTLTIESDTFVNVWSKALSNLGEHNLVSKWRWSENQTEVTLAINKETILLENGAIEKAIFFDNVDYPIWVEFNANVQVKDACLSLPGRIKKEPNSNAKETFAFRESKGMLSGFINFGNEIGNSYLNLSYTLGNGEKKRWKLEFEVLSSKLDYHSHWRTIVTDIENEYRMLSLDFMRRTFHSFSPDNTKNETPKFIWWNIFNGLQQKFIKAAKSIINQPRHRLRDVPEYRRAENIQKFTPQLEEEFSEHKRDESHLYRTMQPTNSNDTPENRFLRHALLEVSSKYNILLTDIKAKTDIAPTISEEMEHVGMELKILSNHPFFRTVGRFTGLSQESQVLQKATGYSEVYRSWIILNKSYSLEDGLHNLETKDIATLYEIWCYIQVKNIIEKSIGEGVSTDNRNRLEMGPLFGYNLSKGQSSSILFKKGDVVAELIYNPQEELNENSDTGVVGMVSKTVVQRPDIVLQLTKDDIEVGMKMTYLFDAKYRINKKVNGVDTPPEDAINQMHRYRDAIYYSSLESEDKLKKEVIGGYILFPGAGNPSDVGNSRFMNSIGEVNIGAFPLRPNDTENIAFLEQFIENIVKKKAEEILEDENMIPQKGLSYITQNHVVRKPQIFVGYVHPRNDMIEKYKEHKAKLYYTGQNVNASIDIQSIAWFAPIVKEAVGEEAYMDGYYKVKNVRVATKSEIGIYEPDENKTGARIMLELDEFIPFEKSLTVNDAFCNSASRGLTYSPTDFENLKQRFS